jgi:hypothetical protein
MIWKFIIT